MLNDSAVLSGGKTFAFAQIAPPTAAPKVELSPVARPSTHAITIATADASQLYSIGNPTNEEQLYLELINRARANPSAEGVRLATITDPDILGAYRSFGVSLALMRTQFAAIAPAPRCR